MPGSKMPGMSTWITQTSWIYGDLISSRACGHQSGTTQSTRDLYSVSLSNARGARRIADADGMQVPWGKASSAKIAERLCGPLLTLAPKKLKLVRPEPEH